MSQAQLANLKNNETATIQEINKCGNSRKRLYELGLYKDAQIEMVKNDFGPVIISLGGCKLAIGRNLANHITVSK